MTEQGGPLTGLLVADFSRVLAGPYATMLLADMGADVVKVEGPPTATRPAPGARRSARASRRTSSASTAASARSCSTCARRRPPGRPRAGRPRRRGDRELQARGMARFGLDFDSVRESNPGVVYASISGFGSGKGAHVPGYDLLVQGVSGLMSLTGDPDGPPYRAGISVFDVMAGNHAVIGILAALRHRDASGEGQHVEVNLLSSALTGLVNHSSAWAAGGVVPYRMGNAHPSVFPYEPLPAADTELIVIAANDRQFARLCAALDIPEVAEDERFRHNADRTANRDELQPILAERLRTRKAEEWFDVLLEAGVPSGPINSIDGGFAMAERFGLEPIVEVGEGDRAIPTTRHPIRFSATPVTYGGPPPGSTSTAPSSANGSPTRRSRERPVVPHGAGCLEPRRHHAAGPGPGARRHGRGRVRRARLLAGDAAPPDSR